LVRFNGRIKPACRRISGARRIQGIDVKITFVSCAAAAALCLWSASASAADTYSCKRVSGGQISSFTMTIDAGAKHIDIPSSTGLAPDPDSIQITDASAHWTYMRGDADFNRKTGRLDWDMTSDYDYLIDIHAMSVGPEKNYKGRVQCTAKRAAH
jgi:hypothetical protein